MADATTLRAAIDRLTTELRDRTDPTVEIFDYVPVPEQAPPVFAYIGVDGATLEAETYRLQMRLVVSGQLGNEQSQSTFIAAVDMLENELDAGSLGDQAVLGWVPDLNAWVCTWTVDVPRSYA